MRPGSPPAPRAIGVALILVGLGGVVVSMGIALDQFGRWGARLFPLAGSCALIVLGLIEMRQVGGGRLDMRNWRAIGGLLLLSVAYVWAVSAFGYLVSTACAAPLALRLFGVRNLWGLGVASLVCPVVLHVVFFEALGVFPPLGRWFDLLDLLGKA